MHGIKISVHKQWHYNCTEQCFQWNTQGATRQHSEYSVAFTFQSDAVWRAINHVFISSWKAPDALIIPYSCVFSHNNLALSCKDSPAHDLCVWVWDRAEEGRARTWPHRRWCFSLFFSSCNLSSCCLCYIYSFPLSVSLSISTQAAVHVLLFPNAGRKNWSWTGELSSQFCDQWIEITNKVKYKLNL